MSNNFTKKVDGKINLTLNDAETGKKYVIVGCDLPKEEKRRFAEMALIEGVEVFVVKKAPLSDPMEIRVKDYSLCIRGRQAKRFYVKECEQ